MGNPACLGQGGIQPALAGTFILRQLVTRPVLLLRQGIQQP